MSGGARLFRAAIDEEAAELEGYARLLSAQSGSRAFQSVIDEMSRTLAQTGHPGEAEEILEAGARRLRRLWLDVASDAANCSYRSPTLDQPVWTATGPAENFGYERELKPKQLEARCRTFFGPAPEGWAADHVVFSSGQAAMAATLHLLEELPDLNGRRPAALAHLGAYFETTEILRLFPSLLCVVASGSAAILDDGAAPPDVLLVEPFFFEQTFFRVDISTVLRKVARRGVVIFDDTLTGAALDPHGDLERLGPAEPAVVARLTSGLKLLQGGVELANVGIVSLYVRECEAAREPTLSSRLRKTRALLGLGLRFADVAALEAPWFLDPDDTRRYCRAVFDNNATLAEAVANGGRLFSSVAHPALNAVGGVAPYVVFRLRDDAGAVSYDKLASVVRAAAGRRRILFSEGGSFGFRGHRYDVVRPEASPPFLRVAAGRRRGWSLEGAIALLRELSS